jgi:hypothetical protein
MLTAKDNRARNPAQESNVIPFDVVAARLIGSDVLDAPLRMTRFNSPLAKSKSDLTLTPRGLGKLIRETVAAAKDKTPVDQAGHIRRQTFSQGLSSPR